MTMLDAFASGGSTGLTQCLTLEQVAGQLGLSVRSVQRLIAAGTLRKLPLGRLRLVRVAPAEVSRLLEGRPHAPDPPPSNDIR